MIDFSGDTGVLRYVVVLLVFVGLSAAVAVVPASLLVAHNDPIPGSQPLSESERLGLDIYNAEGCSYCHTQQVRPLAPDTPGFGRPSAPGDYARLRSLDVWRMVPEITGTERTGPDLADVGRRQSSRTWNYIHLYNPRAVVSASVMQGYPWLFDVVLEPDSSATVVPLPDGFGPDSGQVVVTPRAEHLVDYILSRTQPKIPGYGATTSGAGSGTPSDTATGAAASAGRGARIYSSRCSSCHQANGQGVPGTFPPLAGDPVVTASDPSEHIRIVIAGLSGKAIGGQSYSAAMPPHPDLSDQQVADVVNHERTSWGNDAPTVTARQVRAVRGRASTGGGAGGGTGGGAP